MKLDKFDFTFLIVCVVTAGFLLGVVFESLTSMGAQNESKHVETVSKESAPKVVELRIVVEVKGASSDVKEESTSNKKAYVEAPIVYVDTKESQDQNNVVDETKENDIRLLAQLVQSEAGNQDLTGMRYVADVVLNRVDSPHFPDTIEEVIFQPNQFSVIKNGAFEAAESNISEDAWEAARLEYEERLNEDILYFSRGKSKYADHHFKYQDHWFGW